MNRIRKIAGLNALVLLLCMYANVNAYPFYNIGALAKDSSLPQEFSIGIFWGPPATMSTDEQYKSIKAANVDYIQFTEDAIHPGTDAEKRNTEILDLAQRHGLKYYPADRRVYGNDDDVTALVNAYKDHPATGGYYIKDEPGPDALDRPAEIYRKMLSLDPVHVPYVNLLPDFAVKDYENNYVEKWVEKAGRHNLRYLSFDNYPFMWDGSFRPTYFNNLEIFRRVGLKYDIKTSCYLQSMGILNAYRRPNANELRYSVYSNLAYGIKNIVWFTYCTPTGQPQEKFMSAIIDSSGNKTDLYEPFKKVNGEAQHLGSTLIGLDATEVFHTGSLEGVGLIPLPDNFFWQPQQPENNLIIAHFVRRSDKREFIMVVNKSLTENKQLAFNIRRPVKKVYEISKTGKKHQATDYRRKSGRLSATFLPGEGKLYELK